MFCLPAQRIEFSEHRYFQWIMYNIVTGAHLECISLEPDIDEDEDCKYTDICCYGIDVYLSL